MSTERVCVPLDSFEAVKPVDLGESLQITNNKTIEEAIEAWHEFLDRKRAEKCEERKEAKLLKTDGAIDLRLAELGFCDRFELSEDFADADKVAYYSHKFCIQQPECDLEVPEASDVEIENT